MDLKESKKKCISSYNHFNSIPPLNNGKRKFDVSYFKHFRKLSTSGMDTKGLKDIQTQKIHSPLSNKKLLY